jgi:hypothetical protein
VTGAGEAVLTADDVLQRSISWDQCDAFARHLGDDGRETVIVCSLGRHAPPGDSTQWHYDPDLGDTGVYWKYADEWLSGYADD